MTIILARFFSRALLLAACVLPLSFGTIPTADALSHPARAVAAPPLNTSSHREPYPDTKGALAGTRGFVPATDTAPRAFWQFALIGSYIQNSRVIIAPASVSGGNSEILVAGLSLAGSTAPNDFWQALRFNATTGGYETVFVSSLYDSGVKQLAIGNIIGDGRSEIAVLLFDGRIYLYDSETKAELGHIVTGINGLLSFALADLDGDGYAELIAVTLHDLFVFNAAGDLLWQVPGAGGEDVVVGQMDNDSALEIASTNGAVVDTATHAVQWTRSGGFHYHLALAPCEGEFYQQLLVGNNSGVFSYDVAHESLRWSVNNNGALITIAVANVDGDVTPELLVLDNSGYKLSAFDLLTQAKKWEANSPDAAGDFALGDVDGDEQIDVVLSAQHLSVVESSGSHAVKWKSLALSPPFIGPVIGDVDGDGKDELVACSTGSEGSNSKAVLLIFDRDTLRLRETYSLDPYSQAVSLRLYDLENDGRKDVVIGNFEGSIDIYGFDSEHSFLHKWHSAAKGGSSFNYVELADLEDDETPEAIAGSFNVWIPTNGSYLQIYDYPAAEPWRSMNFTNAFDEGVIGLKVDDFDGNGTTEIAALVSTGNLYTYDGLSRQLLNSWQDADATALGFRPNPSGLIVGDTTGLGHFLKYSSGLYTETLTRQLSEGSINGLTVVADDGLWTGSDGKLNLRRPPSYDSVLWESPFIGGIFGKVVAVDNREGEHRVFSASNHAIVGFVFDHDGPPDPTPTPTVAPSPSATPTPRPSATPSPTIAPSPTVTPKPTPRPAASFVNLSSRVPVETGDNVLIGGFIVGPGEQTGIVIRALGNSLRGAVPDALEDPVLELHKPDGSVVTNDNWADSQAGAIRSFGLAPASAKDSAIFAVFKPGAYTAIVRGKNGATGTALIELYRVNSGATARLINISTRAFVGSGDDVMIGGFIVTKDHGGSVMVRALGPSLAKAGVKGALVDPMLELRDRNGTLVDSNDDWKSNQQAAITKSGIAPTNERESAILKTLNPGAYTAIVRGKNGGTGAALVEVYSMAAP